MKPAGMRQLVLRLQESYRMSERRAVKALGAHRSAIRYRPKRPALDAPIRKQTFEIAEVDPRIRLSATFDEALVLDDNET